MPKLITKVSAESENMALRAHDWGRHFVVMLTGDFLRGRRRGELSETELAAVENAIGEVRTYPARKTVLRAGQSPQFSMYLIEGFMCRYMDATSGRRQLVALQVPGDFVDLHAFPLTYLDHDNATITPCKIGLVPHDRLREIERDMPKLSRMLWFSTLLDAAMHREWIFRMGRLNAVNRLAHLFAETEYRLAMVGRAPDGHFPLPLVQTDLAEAVGITPIHVNRSLRVLRTSGILEFRDGTATILDRERLWHLAEFDPAYLFTDGTSAKELHPTVLPSA